MSKVQHKLGFLAAAICVTLVNSAIVAMDKARKDTGRARALSATELAVLAAPVTPTTGTPAVPSPATAVAVPERVLTPRGFTPAGLRAETASPALRDFSARVPKDAVMASPSKTRVATTAVLAAAVRSRSSVKRDWRGISDVAVSASIAKKITGLSARAAVEAHERALDVRATIDDSASETGSFSGGSEL